MQQLLDFQKCIKLTCGDNILYNNTYLYSISIAYVGENATKYVIHKTKKEIQKFHQSITKYIFELDAPFDKKYINTEDPSETISMINIYLKHIQERLDCLTSRHFINFLQLDQNLPNKIISILTKQYIDQLTDVSINLKDEQVIDFQWQSKQKILFVVSQCKKKTKIQNLFKLFMSSEVGMSGSLQMIRFDEHKGEWINISSQLIQAEPLGLLWDSKNSTLIVSTSIGIYIHMVSVSLVDNPKLTLIDFIQIPGISCVVSDTQIASLYILSNGINYQGKTKLSVYSIKKQSVIQISTKLQNATSMVFQKALRRLYISDQEGIKIFKVENDSQKVIFQNFKKIHTLKSQSTFDQLTLSSEQKPQYLFGYNKRGYITVFEIKPLEKQFLFSVLTNIECPENWTSIERIWSKKLFCVNYHTHLVFISMKNQPIFVKQNGITEGKIRKIIFDEQNQRLMYCDHSKLKICQIYL